MAAQNFWGAAIGGCSGGSLLSLFGLGGGAPASHCEQLQVSPDRRDGKAASTYFSWQSVRVVIQFLSDKLTAISADFPAICLQIAS